MLEEAAASAPIQQEAWGREVEALIGRLEEAMEVCVVLWCTIRVTMTYARAPVLMIPCRYATAQVALCVIGTADEGMPESLFFEKQEADGGDDDDGYRREGPTQTAGTAGFVVDCRGHLIRSRGGAVAGGEGEDEDDVDGDDGKGDTRWVSRMIPGLG